MMRWVKELLCSRDMKKFIADNFLDLSRDNTESPERLSEVIQTRIMFNTAGVVYGRYIHCWMGENAQFTPESMTFILL